MRAIFRREWQAFFFTANAYVYMAVFLALGSVFFAVGNLAPRSGDLAGFLWNMGYLWMLLTPILTMHTYAGERKSRTDQLLFTSPLSLGAVAVGKYLAGCAVLGVTAALSLMCAAIVALWGRLYPGEAACAYLGFLLQGCAFLAIDMYVSARSRSPVTAAVWAFGVNLLLWLTDVLSSAVNIAWISRVLSFLSLYMRAAPFRNGQLSPANILYFLAVIALCLFLTVRALDARRFSDKRRALRNAGLCLLAAAVAAAACAVGDLWEESAAGRVDLSFNRATTLSDTTRSVLHGLTRDVRVYSVSSAGNELNDLNALLDRCQAASPRFTWSRETLSRNPLLLKWVSGDVSDSAVTADCLIVRCEETDRTRVLTWDAYMRFSYDTGSGDYVWTGLTYEQALASALVYVTADDLPRVQILSGHGEVTAGETQALERLLSNANYAPVRVNLAAGGALDPDAALLILSPTLDVSESEAQALADFARAGGGAFVTVDFTDPDELPNLYAFYRLYGVAPRPGLVLADENDRASYYTNIAELTPRLLSVDGLTDDMAGSGADFVLMAPARAFDAVDAGGDGLIRLALLQSGDTSYIKAVRPNELDVTRRADDPAGPFDLALLCDRGFADGTRSAACFFGCSGMFLEQDMLDRTCSGDLLLRVLKRLRGGAGVTLDIAPREAVRPALNPPNTALPALLLALPPLIVAFLAVAILTPRRYL